MAPPPVVVKGPPAAAGPPAPAITVVPTPAAPAGRAIAVITDPALRNLWITQRYHELAVALRDAGAGPDATWCGFAVWASKTAGQAIRGQALPAWFTRWIGAGDTAEAPAGAGLVRRFNARLDGRLVRRLTHGHLAGLVRRASADVASAIADGNLAVFEEIEPLFTALLAEWTGGAGAGGVAGGAGAGGVGSPGPATDLAAAVGLYRAARQEPDPKRRAATVLAANVATVAHEQERLQPNITAALDAGVRDSLLRLVDDDLAPHRAGAGDRHRVMAVAGELARAIEEAWQVALTETVVRLHIQDESLDLGRDVPPIGGVLFPAELAAIDVDEATGPLGRWDLTKGTGRGSGAHDWTVLGQRMNYIVNLFRSRQRHPTLFYPPFTDTQLAAMAAGTVPPGPL